MCGFRNVWVCVFVRLKCEDVCIYGFCNVWKCVFKGLEMCWCLYVWVS